MTSGKEHRIEAATQRHGTTLTKMRVSLIPGSLLVTALALGARAQTTRERLSFEVASVKPNPDTVATPAFDLSPAGRLTVTAYPLFQLIRIAYVSNSIQTEQQIVGGPGWLTSDRFDFVAKANGSIEADETGRPTRLLAMLRALLADRFHLRVHTELREASVYLLVRQIRLVGADGAVAERATTRSKA